MIFLNYWEQSQFNHAIASQKDSFISTELRRKGVSSPNKEIKTMRNGIIFFANGDYIQEKLYFCSVF